ncbi:MAG: SCO family protein [Rhizobiaceae bacterium]
MSTFRYILWVAVFLLGTFLAYQTAMWTLNRNSGGVSFGTANIGGPFEAVRADGSLVTQTDMIGKPHMVFFGFTHCPDVCPTTLYEAGQWMEKLGPDGERVSAWFVTVDPERDTPEILSQYLSAFDTRIDGITGSPEQIAGMVKQWRVFAQKQDTGEGDYTMNHTASTFLMKSDGTFFGTIAYGENAETAVKKLQRLIDADVGAGS